MIRKSLLVCLSLLLLDCALMQVAPNLSAMQSQSQQNLHKAQQYLYAEDNPSTVIVGTSLSTRLVMARLPGCENLSFSGLSIFDGLSLLRHKRVLPSHVFIETNVLLRKKDAYFGPSLFLPVPFFLRQYVVALRADKQPLALVGQSLGNAIRDRGTQIKRRLLGIGPATPSDGDPALVTSGPDERMLDLQIKDYSDPPVKGLLNGQLQLLAEDVAYLKSKGVHVTFFEMPVNPRLNQLLKARLVREGMHATFPTSQFHYIELPPDADSYKTTDGMHLSPPEASRYTQYFVDQAKLIASIE
jgi:hypothetical protein